SQRQVMKTKCNGIRSDRVAATSSLPGRSRARKHTTSGACGLTFIGLCIGWLAWSCSACGRGTAVLLPPIDSIVPGPVPLCGQEQVCRAGAQGQSSSKVPVAAPAPFLRESAAAGLTLDMVVRTTLERNPALEVFRQQRGIAQAGVVIARTYPYNPIVSAQLLDVHGAASPVLNSFQYQPVANLQLEVRGQRHFRKQAAFAALKRTDWEIAFQEVSFAVGAVRTFDTLLYRQAKLGVTEEFVRLNQAAAEQVKRLVDGAVLKPADLLLTQAEVTDV